MAGFAIAAAARNDFLAIHVRIVIAESTSLQDIDSLDRIQPERILESIAILSGEVAEWSNARLC